MGVYNMQDAHNTGAMRSAERRRQLCPAWPIFAEKEKTMKRNATAVWNGSGKQGSGTLTAQSGVLNETPYTWASRFENNPGTNPEELIAAAHAGCFAMKLSFVLGEKNVTPESITATCTITLENGSISESHLEVRCKASGMDAAAFRECADNAKQNCPVSKLLGPGTHITMNASLE